MVITIKDIEKTCEISKASKKFNSIDDYKIQEIDLGNKLLSYRLIFYKDDYEVDHIIHNITLKHGSLNLLNVIKEFSIKRLIDKYIINRLNERILKSDSLNFVIIWKNNSETSSKHFVTKDETLHYVEKLRFLDIAEISIFAGIKPISIKT